MAWNPAQRFEPALQFRFRLDGPLRVRSGELAHHGLLVRNESPFELIISTGQLLANVFGEAGEPVISYYGGLTLQLRLERVPPLATERIGFVVGAGYGGVPSLSPGNWELSLDLPLDDGRVMCTPRLAFEVTP